LAIASEINGKAFFDVPKITSARIPAQ